MGNNNVVYHNTNGWNFEQALRDAILSFPSSCGIYIVNPITDKTLTSAEVLSFDVSNVFADVEGDQVTVTVQSNSDPSKATVNLVGNTLTVTASSTEYSGNTSIVVKGEDVTHGQSDIYEFVVNIAGNEWTGVSITPLNVDIAILPDQTDTDIVNILSGIPSVLNFTGSINFLSKKTTTPKVQWDQQFNYDVTTLSGNVTGQAGCESDGDFIYTTVWSSADILKFGMDGTYIETFQIPMVTSLRDLAYDGEFFYGGAASTTIWKMDFANKTLIGTITSPVAVRAIAYDDASDGFWVNNWSSDMILVGRNGSTLDTIGNIPSCYGAAYDNFSAGGPYLWVNSGTYAGYPATVVQFDIATGTATGVSFQAAVTEIAGGCFIQEEIVFGTATIGVIVQGEQGEQIYGYELCTTKDWLTLTNASGGIPVSGNHDVMLNFDSAGLTLGTVKTATLILRDENNFQYDTPINITMTVSSVVTLESPTDVVTSFFGSNLIIDWNVSTGATNYDVYSSEDPYGEFTLAANVGTNQYTVSASQAKLFYYIVAKN